MDPLPFWFFGSPWMDNECGKTILWNSILRGSTKANNFLAQRLGFQVALLELEFASALPLGNCVTDFHVASGHKQVTPKWDNG